MKVSIFELKFKKNQRHISQLVVAKIHRGGSGSYCCQINPSRLRDRFKKRLNPLNIRKKANSQLNLGEKYL